MEIALTEEQQALKGELRAYYENLLTPELELELSHSNGIGPVVRKVVKQMASDGWLGIGWPKEWGGQGRSAIEQFIFFDESMRSGAPVPMLTINTVGPTIMNFGTQEQKEYFLPKILAGEIHFCIGYTEPNSGTDLASLTTRAVRDGEEYVINGSKIFTSLAGDADYIWLATRTDPNVPKHKGISMFTSGPFPLSAAVVIDQGISDLTLKKVNQTFSALDGSFGPFDEVAVFTYGNTVNQRSDFGNTQRLSIALNRIKDDRGQNAGPQVVGGPFGSGPSTNSKPPVGTNPVLTPAKESHVLNDAILMAAQALSHRPGEPQDHLRHQRRPGVWQPRQLLAGAKGAADGRNHRLCDRRGRCRHAAVQQDRESPHSWLWVQQHPAAVRQCDRRRRA